MIYSSIILLFGTTVPPTETLETFLNESKISNYQYTSQNRLIFWVQFGYLKNVNENKKYSL